MRECLPIRQQERHTSTPIAQQNTRQDDDDDDDDSDDLSLTLSSSAAPSCFSFTCLSSFLSLLSSSFFSRSSGDGAEGVHGGQGEQDDTGHAGQGAGDQGVRVAGSVCGCRVTGGRARGHSTRDHFDIVPDLNRRLCGDAADVNGRVVGIQILDQDLRRHRLQTESLVDVDLSRPSRHHHFVSVFFLDPHDHVRTCNPHKREARIRRAKERGSRETGVNAECRVGKKVKEETLTRERKRHGTEVTGRRRSEARTGAGRQ